MRARTFARPRPPSAEHDRSPRGCRLVDEHDCVRQARVIGLFGCADLVDTVGPNAGNRVSGLQGGGPSNDKIVAFKAALLDEGIISLFRNCMLHVAPPLVISEAELRDGFERVHRALAALG